MKRQLLMLALLAASITELSAQTTATTAQTVAGSGQVATPATARPSAVSPIHRWTVAVSVGGAFPVGEFGSKKAHDSASSFAKTGPLLSLGLDYRLAAHYGLSLSFSGQENATDNKAIAQQLYGFDPSAQYAVNISKWKIGRALAGGWVETALDKEGKWSIRGRLAVGALTTRPPKMSMLTYQPGTGLSGPSISSVTTTYPKSLWAFAWQTGAGLKYTLTRQWSFHLDADYTASSISVYSAAHRSFERIGAVNSSGSLSTGTGTVIIIGSLPPLSTFKLPVNTANLSITAGFSF